MDLGLVCPRCAHLSSLRATECSRCQSSLWQQETVAAQQSSQAQSVKAVGMDHNEPLDEIPEIDAEHVSELAQERHAPAVPANSSAAPQALDTPPDLPRFGTETGQKQPREASEGQKDNASSSPNLAAGQSHTTLHLGPMGSPESCPRVILIKGGAQDGVAYRLGQGEHTLGRQGGDIRFENDEFLSTPHARFVSENGKLAVEDMNSINGVFLRIRSATPLMHDDCFLVGEQLLRVDTRPVPQFAPNERGTYFYGSPRPKGYFRIMQCLAGGGQGRCQSANSGSMSIGRESADFNFPCDRFISGHHARVETDGKDDRLLLHDLRSRNGTFLRIRGRYVLRHGDYLFIGQQLFRIELDEANL